MLGEAAYTKADAARYLRSYRARVAGDREPNRTVHACFERPSISVKLSALHPRYEWVKRERVMRELLPWLIALGGSRRGPPISASRSMRRNPSVSI